MNTEQIAYAVKQPEKIGFQEVSALKVLAESYPYASVYSFLYLTALANSKSVELDSELSKHAYKLSDRTKLYYLLNGASTVTSRTSATEATILTSLTEPVEVREVIEEVKTDDFAKITNAFSAEQSYSLESLIPLAEAAELVEAVEVGEAKETKKIDILPLSPPPKGEDVSEKINVETEIRSFTSWLTVNSNEDSSTESNQKTTKNNIIDQFIQEQPRITRNKTDFFSPSKKAKASIEESTLPVSETLAKIYADQGNYPKAIHVYHQLMVLKPEKKDIFALQIDQLKKKIIQ